MNHVPVLLKEAIRALAIKPAGIYVDATFGRGGHSKSILNQLDEQGSLVVFDKDPEAIKAAQELALRDKRVLVVHSGFQQLARELGRLNITKIDGILFDFGLSAPQLDEAQRGFSFRVDAPLDMRMDNSHGMTAKEWINQVTEQDLANVIKTYGEERFYRKIARAIVAYRKIQAIETTHELANLISRVIKVQKRGLHPATKTFQAIRININRELEEIAIVLPEVLNFLDSGGRLVSIAFHSLEDRIIKQFIKQHSSPKALPSWAMIRNERRCTTLLKSMGRPIKPTDEEKNYNHRARSAIMRVAMRTTGRLDD